MIKTERQKNVLKNTFIDFQQTSYMLEYGVIFEKAEGLYCWDTRGKRYFDALSGVYVATLGHRHPDILEAARKQMEKAVFVPPLHGISDSGLSFIETVGAITPGNLNFIKAFSGGSESNEAAFKLARQYFKQTGHPGKYKIISMYQSYHGATMAAATASGGSSWKAKYEPLVGGFLKIPNPIQFRDSFNTWEETNQFCAQWFEEVIINEDPDTIACIILEPICNTAGIVIPTNEYFQTIRELCSKYNILLIFDEVLTGFAKTGKMFASELSGVVPDIMTSGKGLSGGVCPIAILAADRRIGEAFIGKDEDNVQFSHGHTWAGNPLASAVGKATIEVLIRGKFVEKAEKLGFYMVKKLAALKQYGVIREIRGSGVLRGVEFVMDDKTNEPFPPDRKLGEAFKITSIKNGLILRSDANWFAVCPPLIAEEEDIDELVSLIEKSLVQALDMVKI